MKRAAFVALFFLTTPAFAVDYVWNYLNYPAETYGSAQPACDSHTTNPDAFVGLAPVDNLPDRFKCIRHNNVSGSNYISADTVERTVVQPPPPCTAGTSSTQTFMGSAPSLYCDGQCSHTKDGIQICATFPTLNQTACTADYISTDVPCSDQTSTTDAAASNCGVVDGVTICGNLGETGATESCVTANGKTYCDGAMAAGDCTSMQDGTTICNPPTAADGPVTDKTPKDPTTGQPLQPDAQATATDATGNTSGLAGYTGQTLAENDPYACDNPDTAVFEPCAGYCDNPNTVSNECVADGACQDDPSTPYDETLACSTTQGIECGGFMQPPCDSNGNPITGGDTLSADGVKISGAIKELEKSLQGWTQPVIGEKGMFDQVGASEEVQAAKTSYEQTLNQIRSEAANTVHLNTGSGRLPCWTNLTIPGLPGSYSMCPRNYEPQLSIIGTILIAIATLLAFIVIMR